MTYDWPAVRLFRKPGILDRFGVDLHSADRQKMADLFDELEKLGHSYARVRITVPQRPRTTGYRSQNSRLHGHCQDIADQLGGIYTRDVVKDAMKRLAVTEGYPAVWSDLHGEVIPLPTKDASIEQMQVLLDTIGKYADEHGLYLTEYDEEGRYRSIGGRSREEMARGEA